jgi:hypothetical protein
VQSDGGPLRHDSALAMHRVRLLLQRGAWKEARAMLAELERAVPSDLGVTSLRRELLAREADARDRSMRRRDVRYHHSAPGRASGRTDARDRSMRRRDVRYWLNLSTPWRRGSSMVTAFVLLAAGAHTLVRAIPVALGGGLRAAVQ